MKIAAVLDRVFIFSSIVFLIGALYIAARPAEQVSRERNIQRKTDITVIFKAVEQYKRETGTVPPEIPQGTCGDTNTQICRTTSLTCEGLVDLSAIFEEKRHLITIPTDPTSYNETGTGYFIAKDTKGMVSVCAP